MNKKEKPTAVIHVELFGELGKKFRKYTKERGIQAFTIRQLVRRFVKEMEEGTGK